MIDRNEFAKETVTSNKMAAVNALKRIVNLYTRKAVWRYIVRETFGIEGNETLNAV